MATWPQFGGNLLRTKTVNIAPKPIKQPQSVYIRSAWVHQLTIRIERPNRYTIRAIATSNLSSPENIYYFWYVDGVYKAMTRRPIFEIHILSDEHIRIDVLDSTDPSFDAEAHAPGTIPARHTLYWNPSNQTTAYYRIRQKKSGGSWETIGKISHQTGQWNYWCVTPVLDDQGTYQFDVAAVDVAGNAGATVATDEVKVWRIPDPTDYDAAYSDITNKVTFAVV